MSTKEIASLPAIGRSTKGVGSVIERLKHSIRDQMLGAGSDGALNQGKSEKANTVQNSY
jgi:hypothetical protein